MTDADLHRFVALARAALRDLPPDLPLDCDSRLIDLGLDSLGMVTLVMAVETEFQVTFPDELLVMETFHTLGEAWELVSQLRDGPEALNAATDHRRTDHASG